MSGVSAVGWVAVGAVAAAAVIAAAVIAVSGGSSTTNTADQPSQPTFASSAASGAASGAGLTDDTLSGTFGLPGPPTSAEESTVSETTAGDTSISTADTSAASDTATTGETTSATDTSPPPLTPALPIPTDLTLSQPLVAGGTGAFSLTVTNTGQQDSDPTAPLDIALPAGLAVQSVDVAPNAPGLRRAALGNALARAPTACQPTADQTCSVPLGVLTPDGQVAVTITVTVAPDVQANSTATVTIAGHSVSTLIQPEQIRVGISSLTAFPNSPYPAPSATTMTVTAIAQPGVLDPGPLTFTLGGTDVLFTASPANCTPVGEGGATLVTCTGPEIDGLILTIGSGQSEGPLPLTVTDAGNRNVPLTDADGNPLQVTPVPAQLSLDDIQTAPIVAGGSGIASLTVTNIGNQTSTETPIGYTLPSGVAVAAVEAGTGRCVPTEASPCLLPPIDPRVSATVILTLIATPTTQPGALTVTIAGQSKETQLSVDSGIVNVVAAPDSPYLTPSATTMNLQVNTKPGVQDAGPVTFTLADAATSFTAVPDGCSPAAPTQQVSCTDTAINGLTLTITQDQPAGLLPLKVTDARGLDVTITDEVGSQLEVTPASQLTLSPISAAPLIAGGIGTASITVQSTGVLPSDPTPIGYTTPTGVTVTSIQIGAAACDPSVQTCTIPPLDPPQSQIISFLLRATPQATGGSFTLAIAGQYPTTTLAVEPGIGTLVASPNGPYLAPSATSMTIQVTAEPGVTDPGPITLTLTDPATTFAATPAACTPVGDGTTQLTCTGPTISGLALTITRDQQAGLLPLVVTDAGDREIALLDGTGNPLQVAPAPTAQLSVAVTDVSALPAGGTGSLTVTASNDSGQPSYPAPIGYRFPTGIDVTGIDIDGAACGPGQGACILPPIDPGTPRTISFQLAEAPQATGGEISVTAAGQTARSTVTVGTGIATLTASPNGPYLAPSTTALDIAVTPQPGVQDPGPITFTVTGTAVWFAGWPTACTPAPAGDPPTQQVTCTGSTISGLALTIGRDQPAGPLPLTVTDAGHRDVTPTLTDGAGNELWVAAEPAALSVSPIPATPIVAGGTGSASFTVTNNGALPSGATPITYTPPTGIDVTSVEAGAGRCAPTPASPCQLPPIGPGAHATVALTLAAGPTAQDPSRLQVSIGGQPASTDLSVTSGFAMLIAAPDSPYLAPSVTTVNLQAGYEPGIDRPGPLTLTLTGGAVSFTATPDGCTPAGAAPTQQLTCTGPTISGLQLTITRDQPAGRLPLDVTDAGGRPVQITDEAGQELEVVPAQLAQLTLSPIDAPPLTAGGTGTFTMTVTNDGGQPSDPAQLSYSPPDGITVTSVQIGDATCMPGGACTLPPLNPGQTSAIAFRLFVPPQQPRDGSALSVTVGGQTVNAPVTWTPASPR